MGSRVQVTVNGRAEQLWNLLPRMSRSLAIEQALLLLAKDEKLSSVFFPDSDVIDAIFNKTKKDSQPIESVKIAPKESKKESTKSKNQTTQVETAWG